MSWRAKAAILGWCLGAAAAAAEKDPGTDHPDKAVIGIFLPASVPDADERFRVGEALATALSDATHRPVTSRAFGRWEDLQKAAKDGQLDLAVVEAYAAAEARVDWPVLARATLGGEELPRWVLVSSTAATLSELTHQRVAVIRGATSGDQFLDQAIFGGDLPKDRFVLVPVPSVESALKVLRSGSAEAAVIPISAAPGDLRILYRSPPIPGPLVFALRPDAEKLGLPLVGLSAVAPLGKFVLARTNPLPELRRLLRDGPLRRPFFAESGTYRLDPSALLKDQLPAAPLPPTTDAVTFPELTFDE